MPTYGDVLRKRYKGYVREKAARDRGEDPQTILKSGLRDFDRRAGIDRGVLTVVGAATGEGKSIFAKHLQEHTAQRGMKALLLSFEDPPDRTADRTFSTLTNINNAKLVQGVDGDDLVKLKDALSEALEWADNIEYHYGLQTPEDALEVIVDSDAALVQVDYAQAFPDGDKGLERTISDFAWLLNEDAQKKNRATLIYSQLKGEVEKRGVERAEASRRFGKDGKSEKSDIEGFRPFGAGDLAWSQALGQRAKGLGFLFRPNRYRKRYGENVKDDRMELIWPKKNFGAEGRVVVGFDGKTARLFDLAEKDSNGKD